MKNLFLLGGLLFTLLAVGCGAKKPAAAAAEPQMISGNMLVLMVPSAKPKDLETAFSEYSFKSGGPASRSQNKYRFSFAARGITAEALTAKVEAHDLVREAGIVKPIKQ